MIRLQAHNLKVVSSGATPVSPDISPEVNLSLGDEEGVRQLGDEGDDPSATRLKPIPRLLLKAQRRVLTGREDEEGSPSPGPWTRRPKDLRDTASDSGVYARRRPGFSLFRIALNDGYSVVRRSIQLSYGRKILSTSTRVFGRLQFPIQPIESMLGHIRRSI
jgi:hypothetical protein